MPINIRDPRAAALAKQLATRRGITMTAAIVQALEAEIKRDREAPPLRARLAQIATKVRAIAGPKARPISRKEIDSMWER